MAEPERAPRRVAVVCRHPATLRQVTQAVGVVGLGMRQVIGPTFLPRSQPGELDAVLLDLDVDTETAPAQLVESVSALCPETPVIAIAGLRTRQRLIESLAHTAVAGLSPKQGTWLETIGAQPATAAEGPDEQDLATALRRLVEKPAIPTGPGPFLLGGTPIHDRVIGSSTEKDEALTAVLQLAQRLGLSDEKLRRIEVCTDELLLNAMFDAPREPDGTLRYISHDRKTPLSLPAQAQVRLRFGTDGRQFVISVADRFGALERAQLATHLQRVLEARGPRPRQNTPGAGLGLVLVFGACTQLAVHVTAGRFSEVTAVVHISGSNRAALTRGSALYLTYLA